MSRVPLSQLLLQIMILFREALYRSREGLDLSFNAVDLSGSSS